jgi:hypothetical protein
VIFGLLGASLGLMLTREAPNFVQILMPALLAFILGLVAYYLKTQFVILAGGFLVAVAAGFPTVLAGIGFIVGCGLRDASAMTN